MQTNNYQQVAIQRITLPVLANVKALFALSKPNIVGLTLVAALTGIYVGNRGMLPSIDLMLWLAVTLGLATAGACMLNNVYDQDIDRIMKRTRARGLVAGSISPSLALIVALILSTLPLAVMAIAVNVLAAALTAAAVIGYVVIYTMMAKRRTPWANQLGGIAGALPPVIGYAAVTGAVDTQAMILFAIMAVWQQPHALSLALKYREDYARAGVPVVPVAKGVMATKVRIAIYTAILLPLSAMPFVYGIAGYLYLLTAIIVSAMFLYKAVRFLLSDKDYDIKLFLFSLVHLIVLFGAMVVDIAPGIIY